MAERDWQADWELCQQAKEKAAEIIQHPWWLIEIPMEYKLEVWLHHLGFLEKALEGWPAALEERARLEARVKELEQLVCDFQAAALLGIDPDGITPELVEHEITTLRLRVQELETENAHLKAVIDAAKWVRETWVNNWEREIMEVDYGPAKKLDDALRALASLEEAEKNA